MHSWCCYERVKVTKHISKDKENKDSFIGPQEFVVGYSKAPEQPQSSARPICHSHAMTSMGREPASIRTAPWETCKSHFICVFGPGFWVKVQLKTEVLHTLSSTRPGFELMISRSWQYISCLWDACCNHSSINDFSRNVLPWRSEVWSDFKCTGSQVDWCTGNFIFSVQVWFKDRSTTHPKLDSTGVWTHDLQIM